MEFIIYKDSEIVFKCDDYNVAMDKAAELSLTVPTGLSLTAIDVVDGVEDFSTEDELWMN